LHQQHRQVPGRAGGHLALNGVDDQVAAGDQLAGQAACHRVQGVHQLLRRHARAGQGVGGRAQLAHDRGRLQAPAHHVADQHADAASSQRDEVEPVAAHPGPPGARPVRLHAGNLGRGSHQGVLQGQRDMALLLVQAGDFLLGAFVLGDIAGDGAAAHDRAAACPHRAHKDVNVQQASPAGHPERLIVIDPLTRAAGAAQTPPRRLVFFVISHEK
jgi:hypothetical protein